MTDSRLSLAIEAAGGLPDAGPVLLLHPGLAADLSIFSKKKTVIVSGFFPDCEGFAAQGYQVAARPEGAFAMAVVFMPRARARARALVAEAVAAVGPGATVWVDGQKTDGIDTLWKDIRSRVAAGESFAKAHGRAFGFAAPAAAVFADWVARDQVPVPGFVTRPGVFSADGIDPGSALLAAHLPGDLKGKGADLGAGWGWLAAQVLRQPAVRELHLVEADAEALACARANIGDARAQFHWADVPRFHPGAAMDFVVMNPPFHQGRAAEPALGVGFIKAAAAMLQPGGRLFMVANRTLPYEEALRGSFMTVTQLAVAGGFKVLAAARPLRKR